MSWVDDYDMLFCDICSQAAAVLSTPEAYAQWAVEHDHEDIAYPLSIAWK